VKLLRLAGTMLRFRIASLLLPFFLLAPALHGELTTFRWTYVAGVIALFACYVVATCLNDIFDLEVDRANASDRPLVNGQATRRQLLVIAAVAAVVAVLVAPFALAPVVLSLLFDVAYSAPPLRISARPHLAAPALGLAYVAVPYAIGLAAADVGPTSFDARVVAALVVLFTGRMLLKDFRDRRGDAAFGKRTFLLVHGKRATIATVLVCVLVGDALLVTVLPSLVLIAVLQTYFAAIAFELSQLYREDSLLPIARGARMGSAVILTWLGFAVLPGPEGNVFAVALGAIYWLVYASGTLPTRRPAAADLPGKRGGEVELPAPAAASSATTA